MSAGVDIYAAAIKVQSIQCSRTAIDNAALDGFFASLTQHPQAVAVRCEPAPLRIRPAVGDGQMPAALHRKNAGAAGHPQHIAIQIQRGLARDLQRTADAHVLRQRIHAVAQTVGQIVVNGVLFQFRSGGGNVDTSAGAAARLHGYPGILAHGIARRQHLYRQQAQRHAQRHQGRNDPFPHAAPLFPGLSPILSSLVPLSGPLACPLSSRIPRHSYVLSHPASPVARIFSRLVPDSSPALSFSVSRPAPLAYSLGSPVPGRLAVRAFFISRPGSSFAPAFSGLSVLSCPLYLYLRRRPAGLSLPSARLLPTGLLLCSRLLSAGRLSCCSLPRSALGRLPAGGVAHVPL